jgi:type IV secretion system protein VirB10
MSKPFVPPSSPWTPASERLAVPSLACIDPRLELSGDELSVASRNAYPIIAKQKARSDSFGLLAGAAVALVLGAVTFASMNMGRSEKPLPAPFGTQQATIAAARARPWTASPAPVGPMMPSDALTQVQPAQIGSPMSAATGVGVPKARMPALGSGSSPIVVFDGSNPVGGASSRNSLLSDPGSPALFAPSGAPTAGGIESNSVRSTAMADPANTVVQGTLIPAVLETAIQSDLPGFARAVVSQDVRSFDGSKILVPRSSRLIGEYKGGISAGQKRVYLMWTRLVRPDGVSIALASPAVDSAGQTGIGGKVNDHFLQRFGSAILLSLLGSASALGTSGATIVMGAGGQSAASVAAQHDSQRAPTIRVMQGEPIRVFTARDLIFGSGNGAKE